MNKRATMAQIKIFHSFLSTETLRSLIANKVNSFGSLSLSKLLTSLLNEAEIEELNNKIFNKEIR